MRIVVCDDDSFMREMVEAIIAQAGHEVVGVAATTAAADGLIRSAHPDVVVLDPSLSYGTDFDLIELAHTVGARTVVFSQHADADHLHQYGILPEVVPKPDFATLEAVLADLEAPADDDDSDDDRRKRPIRAAIGPVPTGVGDAQAFFEAVNAARAGDALVGFDVPAGAETVADDVGRRLRGTDRVLLNLPRAVRCYLPGGGDEGIRSVLARMSTVSSVTDDCRATAVIVQEGEHGSDAFDRLKHEGHAQPL